MTSRERILAAISGSPVDHVPLTTWCFGFTPPVHLRWRRAGREVAHWFSMRMEHIHTLPEPWTLEDDFARVRAWLSAGIDDVLDVSVPWSAGPGVTWADSRVESGKLDARPVLVREYYTPSGPLRHAVRQTCEQTGPGWVVQADSVPLFEDYNIPRSMEHAVACPGDVDPVAHLYIGPDPEAKQLFAQRMMKVRDFAQRVGVAVQAWSAFGMDAVVWLTGVEGAVMLAMDEPDAFRRLVSIVAAADRARTELVAGEPGVDILVQRGWYSSTDFWSPKLFDRYIFPHVAELAAIAHGHGKKFAYVMTTGVKILGPRLADAGVDLLYFVDPVQDGIPLETARDLLVGRMALVGGTSALTLQCGDSRRIGDEVRCALDVLAPTGRFILHSVDAIFPDTPWEGVLAMIEAWRSHQGIERDAGAPGVTDGEPPCPAQ